MTKQQGKSAVLSVTKGDGALEEVLITNEFDSPALYAAATAAIKILAAVKFRGSVTLSAKVGDQPTWTSVVTFTDDIPQGTWLDTIH